MRNGRKHSRATSGQALVEFTLVLPLLLVLFFSIIEFSLFFYTRVSLRHVVRESARFAVTGNVLTDSTGTPMTRVQSIERMILNGATGFTLSPSNITVTPADGGGPGAVVRIAVHYDYAARLPPFRIFFPNGHVNIDVATVTKNESY